LQRWHDRHFGNICPSDLEWHDRTSVTGSDLLGREDVRRLWLLNQVFCDEACVVYGEDVATV
jgi:hypothetical protein